MSLVTRTSLACAALLVLVAQRTHAEPLTIDLHTAIARARERAPEAVAALARIGEARAEQADARVWFHHNPEVQIGAGPRYGTERTLAIQGQVVQQLEPTRRGARVRVADAAVAHSQALSEAALRELSFEVASLFFEAKFADLAVELAQRDQNVAKLAADAAGRRRSAGDITDLDVNLATIALGRARSAVAAAKAERADVVGRLGAVIGARPSETIALTGEWLPSPMTLEALRAAVPARADVKALAAESRVATAEGTLAAAGGRPDVGVWFGYELDQGESTLLGGLTLTLPLWNRAQGAKAAARAKRTRVELEQAAIVSSASRQIVDAFTAYVNARDSVEIFERDVLPTLTDSEQLLQRSVETGQIAVNDYLVARQEILSGRREYLSRQLQLAKTAATAKFVAGVSP